MSIIINPNNPKLPRSDIDIIFDTMRVIASYRQSFFDLEAAKQSDGVTEITASDIAKIDNAQQRLMGDMVHFILYGDSQHGRQFNTDGKTPTQNPQENAPQLTQTAER